jgi:hypothetical protein
MHMYMQNIVVITFSVFLFLFKDTSISALVRNKVCLLKLSTFPAAANSHSLATLRKGIRREHEGNFRCEVLFSPIGFYITALECYFISSN